MASEVFFYFNVQARLFRACALVQAAWRRRKTLSVWLSGAADAKELNERLWKEGQYSFVPHCFVNDPLAAETPVHLCTVPGQWRAETDRLMLLPAATDEGLDAFLAGLNSFLQVPTLVELVSSDAEDKRLAHQRAKIYIQAGCQLTYIDDKK